MKPTKKDLKFLRRKQKEENIRLFKTLTSKEIKDYFKELSLIKLFKFEEAVKKELEKRKLKLKKLNLNKIDKLYGNN